MTQVKKLKYVIDGCVGRIIQQPICPCCGSNSSTTVDSKFPYLLKGCRQCSLQYRYPREDQEQMRRFYQSNYSQSGLTTDLPDDEELAGLMATNFSGTAKDLTRFLDLFNVLKIPSGSRVLDYGANWGYHGYQFREAGFECTGYEISKPRAAFGDKLGVSVVSHWPEIQKNAPYDVAFSSHVLEHTPDPKEAILQQIAVLKPGGWLIAVFPNGSSEFKAANPERFHRLWGKVHPVMLTDEFLKNVLKGTALYLGQIGAKHTPSIAAWDQKTTIVDDLTDGELLVICRLPEKENGS